MTLTIQYESTLGLDLIVCVSVYKSSMQPPKPLGLSIGSVLTFVQVLGVYNSYAVDTPQLFKSSADEGSSKTEFDLAALVSFPVDCFTGNRFIARYVGKVIRPLILAIGFVIVFLLGRLPRAASERGMGREVAHPSELLPVSGRLRRLYEKLNGPLKLGELLGCFWPVRWSDLTTRC